MKKIKFLLIIFIFTLFTNMAFSQEHVQCNDIKKYLKRMACKTKSAKNIIGSKITSTKEGIGKIFKKENY